MVVGGIFDDDGYKSDDSEIHNFLEGDEILAGKN